MRRDDDSIHIEDKCVNVSQLLLNIRRLDFPLDPRKIVRRSFNYRDRDNFGQFVGVRRFEDGAKRFKHMPGSLDHEQPFRRICNFAIPSVEAANRRNYGYTSGQTLVDKPAGKALGFIKGATRVEDDDLIGQANISCGMLLTSNVTITAPLR
jgi:hypothetical protein